ncbi:MAG TPA: tetratricopeptide repeat protein [Flavipsychrobacter sp.]
MKKTADTCVYLRVASLVFLLLFGTHMCVGQETRLHLPEHKSKERKNDTSYVNFLLAQSDSIKIADRNLSIRILQSAIDKSKAIGFSNGFFSAIYKLSQLYINNNEPEKVLALMAKYAPYYDKEHMKQVTTWYEQISHAYYYMHKYETSLSYIYRSQSLLNKENSHQDSSDIYTKLGVIWSAIGELTYALQNYKIAEEIAIRNNDSVMLSMLNINLGAIHFKRGELDEAEYYNRRSWERAVKKASPFHKTIVLGNLGAISDKRNNHDSAIYYLKQAVALAKEKNVGLKALIQMQTALGGVYVNAQQYSKAKAILLQTEQLAKGSQLEQSLYHPLSELYHILGDDKKASDYLQQLIPLKDTQYNHEKISSMNVLLNARMADKDKAMVAQQLRISKQKSELQKKNFWIGGTTLGCLLLLSFSVVVVRNNKHKQTIQKSYIHQLQKDREISQLKAQVRGEEQERQRIARELHDNIASQLWAIKLNVDSMLQNKAQQKKGLNTIFQQLDDATQDIRKTAHNLLPDLLLEDGLSTAIASLCEKTGRNSRLEVDFQEYGTVPRIHTDIELSLYRMVQELIQNAMKHAKDATHLLVQLSCADTLLNITVEDNGQSAGTEQPGGIGLQQIRKRVQALKGHFDFQRIPGKGTTAYLELDLQHFL